MQLLDNCSLADFYNPAVKADATMMAIAKALDPSLAATRSMIGANIVISNLEAQTDAVLDFIALYHYNVVYWDASLDRGTKLRLLRNAIQDKIALGTPSAIKTLVNNVFQYCELQEWWQLSPPGPANTFQVTIADPLSDPVKVTNLVRAINVTKNVRSLFLGFLSFQTVTGLPVLTIPSIAEYSYQEIRAA